MTRNDLANSLLGMNSGAEAATRTKCRTIPTTVVLLTRYGGLLATLKAEAYGGRENLNLDFIEQ